MLLIVRLWVDSTLSIQQNLIFKVCLLKSRFYIQVELSSSFVYTSYSENGVFFGKDEVWWAQVLVDLWFGTDEVAPRLALLGIIQSL